MKSQAIPTTPRAFDLARPDEFARWRARKLALHSRHIEDLIVEIRNPRRLTDNEVNALLQRCRRANMAIYASHSQDDPDKEIPRQLGRRLGLTHLDHNQGADDDAISSITVQTDTFRRDYIPYSSRPIAWHTDGYYNAPDRQIHAMVLHCVQPAAEGGKNQLLDPEIVYILLRDRDPEFIRSLMHPRAMTIPPNIVDGAELRPERTGPVFSVLPDGHLHMRYTDRSRNIQWRDDATTVEAVAALKDILHKETQWHFCTKLSPGWGLVGNNPLHTRTEFTDGVQPRLLYRARYYDRIAGT